VIGDVHGAYRALKQLIDRVKPQKEDRLIFLGDYVDGWSEALEVVDYLIHLSSEFDCVFIRGNHDVKCYEWLKDRKVMGDWLAHGGDMTRASYENASYEKIALHLDFLENLKNFYIDDENRLFIHAGFTSMKGVQKEEYTSNYYWDRTLWEMAYALDPTLSTNSKKYPKRLALYQEIFIGHTATTSYEKDQPIQAANVWNVDTGAAFTGRITALNVRDKALYQSDVVQDLYPNEKGRN